MYEFQEDDVDFEKYAEENEASSNVLPATAFRDAVKQSFRARRDGERVYLPWEKTRDMFEFRRGETTVWAGYNGHGKSQTTDQVKLSLITQNQKVGAASFEMKPVANLRRLARMHAGTNLYSDEFQGEDGLEAVDQLTDEFFDWSNNAFWIYNQTGQVNTKKVIGFVRYCARELKCQHIFIDNLAKCVQNEDDYNGQKAFIERMCAMAHDENVHIHIVHHLKKSDGGEGSKPDKSDVKGSGAITDQPDNLFLVWRNKPKEESRKAGKSDKEQEPDQVLFCRKQRNYEGNSEGEPTILLWYHRDSLQYVSSAVDGAMFFGNYPHYQSL